MHPAVALAAELIRRPSVTPNDAGCQDMLRSRLEPLGFRCEALDAGGVRNLWAVRGETGPCLAFVGHTDVVPSGPPEAWSRPPFGGEVIDGFLHGRGAADMKGGLGAMVTAIEAFLETHPEPYGRIALLVTSDEEGAAVHGIRHAAEVLADRGELPTWALVGEPTAEARFGDTIKPGRRGSLTGRLRVHGRQGHVAYPHLAENPIHRALPGLAALLEPLDEGHGPFPPSSLQIVETTAGTGTNNVIPPTFDVMFNVRFNTRWNAATLQAELERRLRDAGAGRFDLDWSLSGEPFLAPDGAFLAAVEAAVADVCGAPPARSTSGGTSDGRFLAPRGVEVVELGPSNATIHQVDERVATAELEAMHAVCGRLLERLLT